MLELLTLASLVAQPALAADTPAAALKRAQLYPATFAEARKRCSQNGDTAVDPEKKKAHEALESDARAQQQAMMAQTGGYVRPTAEDMKLMSEMSQELTKPGPNPPALMSQLRDQFAEGVQRLTADTEAAHQKRLEACPQAEAKCEQASLRKRYNERAKKVDELLRKTRAKWQETYQAAVTQANDHAAFVSRSVPKAKGATLKAQLNGITTQDWALVAGVLDTASSACKGAVEAVPPLEQ